jgi:predicted TIM-barrel fold metal-dependent hydrolase
MPSHELDDSDAANVSPATVRTAMQFAIAHPKFASLLPRKVRARMETNMESEMALHIGESLNVTRRDALIGAVGAGACCAASAEAALAKSAAGSTPTAIPKKRDEAKMPKIDIYNHVMPLPYLELMKARYKDQGMIKRMTGIRILYDMDARVEMLNQWPEVQQVLTLGNPPPEQLAGPEESPMLARVANDGLAAICAKHPAKFPAFVATMPMNNVPAAIAEMDRAIGDLGARGIEIKTNVNGRPLDDPDFLPVFEHATNKHGVPIWVHPIRSAAMTDYKAEPKSRFEIWQVMGWPYETTAAMARMVFSGMLDKLPTMRIITHHCGGMLPFFGGRAETLWAQIGSRTSDEDYSHILSSLKKPFMDYFRMFYGDTVLGGSTSALRCGLDFFGPERVVFASDCPFDPEGGPMFIREGIRSIEELDVPDAVKRKIYFENAKLLLNVGAKALPR